MGNFITLAIPSYSASGYPTPADAELTRGPEEGIEVSSEAVGIVPVSADEATPQPVAAMRFDGYTPMHSIFRHTSPNEHAHANENEAPAGSSSLFGNTGPVSGDTFLKAVFDNLSFGLGDPSKLAAGIACIPSVLEKESRQTLEQIAMVILGEVPEDAKQELDLFIGAVLINELFPDRTSTARRDMLIACTKHDVAFVRACAVTALLDYVNTFNENLEDNPWPDQAQLVFISPVLSALIDLMKREKDPTIRAMILRGADEEELDAGEATEEDYANEVGDIQNSPYFKMLEQLASQISSIVSTTKGFKN